MPPGYGRPYPRHTNLGKIMLARNLTKSEVVRRSGVHERTMTEYLAGRVTILPHHKLELAKVLEVPTSYL